MTETYCTALSCTAVHCPERFSITAVLMFYGPMEISDWKPVVIAGSSSWYVLLGVWSKSTCRKRVHSRLLLFLYTYCYTSIFRVHYTSMYKTRCDARIQIAYPYRHRTTPVRSLYIGNVYSTRREAFAKLRSISISAFPGNTRREFHRFIDSTRFTTTIVCISYIISSSCLNVRIGRWGFQVAMMFAKNTLV